MSCCNFSWMPTHSLTTANLPMGLNGHEVMAVLDAGGSGPVFSVEEFRAALRSLNPLEYQTEFFFERGRLLRFNRPSRDCDHTRCHCPAFWTHPLKRAACG